MQLSLWKAFMQQADTGGGQKHVPDLVLLTDEDFMKVLQGVYPVCRFGPDRG